MVGRRQGHLAAYGGRAGKEQMVQRQGSQIGCGSGIALQHSQFVVGKMAWHQIGQQRAGMRRVFAGFDDDAVACCQRTDHRAQCQQQRVVPGRNHAHHAQRHRLHPGPRRPQLQRRANAPRG